MNKIISIAKSNASIIIAGIAVLGLMACVATAIIVAMSNNSEWVLL